jgi:type II secretory pathway predicted ATPase ExeA
VGWPAYWGLSRDPFLDGEPSEVPLSEQAEAVARLIHLVDCGRRWGLLTGPDGVGKTRVLHRALAEMRRPSRRFVRVSGPIDAASLYARIAEGLGTRAPLGTDRGTAWRLLERAARICAVQGQHLVLAVDEADALFLGGERADLLRLGLLGEVCGGRATVLVVAGDEALGWDGAGPDWSLRLRLRPLILSDARHYLEAKLISAGGGETLFSPRAVHRLHLLSQGTPRGLDRLASLCLMTAAARGLEAVSSELVDGLAGAFAGSEAQGIPVLSSAS